MDFIPIIIGLGALIVGVIAGRLIFARDTKKQLVEAEQQAEKIIADAKAQSETIKKEKNARGKREFCSTQSRA